MYVPIRILFRSPEKSHEHVDSSNCTENCGAAACGSLGGECGTFTAEKCILSVRNDGLNSFYIPVTPRAGR